MCTNHTTCVRETKTLPEHLVLDGIVVPAAGTAEGGHAAIAPDHILRLDLIALDTLVEKPIVCLLDEAGDALRARVPRYTHAVGEVVDDDVAVTKAGIFSTHFDLQGMRTSGRKH